MQTFEDPVNRRFRDFYFKTCPAEILDASQDPGYNSSITLFETWVAKSYVKIVVKR